MHTLSIVATIILAPLAFAQDAALNLQAIRAHFTQSALVPDLFTSLQPSALITLNFEGVGDLKPGQALTKEQAAPVPKITVTPGNSSVSLTGNYTLAMIDADIVGAKLPEGQTRHWLVNGVKVSGSTISNTSAVGVTSYAGPWPAAGSGPHRYVVVLYDQPTSFQPPSDLSSPGAPVAAFVWSNYVSTSGLGPLVAATYFTVQEGTSTVSVSPTSAVVTSTLPAYSASRSGSASTTANNSVKTGGATGGAVTLSADGFIFTLTVAFSILSAIF